MPRASTRFAAPALLHDQPGWRDDGDGPAIGAANGVAGSHGLTSATDIFTWQGQPFSWSDPAVPAGHLRAGLPEQRGRDGRAVRRRPDRLDDLERERALGQLLRRAARSRRGRHRAERRDLLAQRQRGARGQHAAGPHRTPRGEHLVSPPPRGPEARAHLRAPGCGPHAARRLRRPRPRSSPPARSRARTRWAQGRPLHATSRSRPCIRRTRTTTRSRGARTTPSRGSSARKRRPSNSRAWRRRPPGAGHVQVDWVTLTETRNSGFEVQRSADSLSGYVTLPGSFVAGHGTTRVAHAYGYTDSDRADRDWYYRLRQIALNGEASYTAFARVTVTDRGRRPRSPARVRARAEPAQPLPREFADPLCVTARMSCDAGGVRRDRAASGHAGGWAAEGGAIRGPLGAPRASERGLLVPAEWWRAQRQAEGAAAQLAFARPIESIATARQATRAGRSASPRWCLQGSPAVRPALRCGVRPRPVPGLEVPMLPRVPVPLAGISPRWPHSPLRRRRPILSRSTTCSRWTASPTRRSRPTAGRSPSS